MPIDEFINLAFGKLLDLRASSQRLLEALHARQREGLVIQRIGDILLNACIEFRLVYPAYTRNLPIAQKLLKDEIDRSTEFRSFLEVSYG